MARHVYRPTTKSAKSPWPVIAGVLATVGVFIAIPLTQKLSDMTSPSVPPPPEFTVEAPDDPNFDTEVPPDDPEPEPEPEDMVDEPTNLDLGMELADLGVGTGGGFVIDVSNFKFGGEDGMMGGELDAPPSPVHKMPPTYPSSLLSRGIGGRVVVQCVVGTDGGVVSTRIESSSGHSELDKAAINAVKRWKFKPGTRSGKKVKATCNVPFNFEVKK